jgi:hypothetical protein
MTRPAEGDALLSCCIHSWMRTQVIVWWQTVLAPAPYVEFAKLDDADG